MKQNVYFVSGIDTDAGKSYATGYLAREWNQHGKRTITQKFIQTGNVGHSEDIDLHRHIMGIPFTEEDREGLTMPEIYSYPASPHLASELDNRPINFDKIKRSTEILSERYDYVLLEGAGGLMVPLTTKLLTIDYIAQEKYPPVSEIYFSHPQRGISSASRFVNRHSPSPTLLIFPLTGNIQ